MQKRRPFTPDLGERLIEEAKRAGQRLSNCLPVRGVKAS